MLSYAVSKGIPDMKPTKKSRHGLHKDSKILLGGMVEPYKKAVAVVTAAVVAGSGEPLTQTDIIWVGIRSLAERYNVLDRDGNATPAYADAITLAEETIVAENQQNRGTRGGKRGAK